MSYSKTTFCPGFWLLFSVALCSAAALPSREERLFKKCYFGDYRFSEDLDFSATEALPPSDQLFTTMIDVVRATEARIAPYANLKLSVDPYTENEPHPHGQEAFQVRAQFPWQREPLTKVMIEISRNELLLLPTCRCALIHEYGEPIEQQVVVYSLEEIILEKLRAVLQQTKKLHERDWNRSRARDFYDLWRILHAFSDRLDIDNFPYLLGKKCLHRQVMFSDADSFFHDKMLTNLRETWQQWLAPLVPGLPSCETVKGELRPKISDLLACKKPSSHGLLEVTKRINLS
jgi:uncharacterized protein